MTRQNCFYGKCRTGVTPILKAIRQEWRKWQWWTAVMISSLTDCATLPCSSLWWFPRVTWLIFWRSDIFVLFSARHCSRCRRYHYYYKNKTILLFQAIWPTLFCLTLMVVGCSSATICAFMWQIKKMMESRGSRRGCVFMIRAAVQRIYAQTNVTTLIISICLIIYETERFIITCWMWEQGNKKKKKGKVVQ